MWYSSVSNVSRANKWEPFNSIWYCTTGHMTALASGELADCGLSTTDM